MLYVLEEFPHTKCHNSKNSTYPKNSNCAIHNPVTEAQATRYTAGNMSRGPDMFPICRIDHQGTLQVKDPHLINPYLVFVLRVLIYCIITGVKGEISEIMVLIVNRA